ncbi:MAG: 1-deoxy-D-xylulose-5-phosphate synthase [Nocardioidaceae bacterium]
MSVLDSITSPADLRTLDPEQLEVLAAELRDFLVSSVCQTGGHLGPNLGVVELTLAVHRVFDSPRAPIVFDTGHQAYVHKLLTGRREGFARLRTSGGLSGYPNRAESVHDVVENSHASTALSYADGLSKAFSVSGESGRKVVVVVGDGALTGGLAWEALNNLGTSGRGVIVVLNDNQRSYSPTVGGLPHHLRRLCDRAGYDRLAHTLGGAAAPAATPTPGSLFADLGFSYLGPVDGHNMPALEVALQRANSERGPVLVHCQTRKGCGYTPAESDDDDHLHTVGVVDSRTGKPAGGSSPTWSDAFGDSLLEIGAERPDVVAVAAAMLGPTKLQRFADRYPGRCFDVGIAEQHAITSAAGLAMGGMHPVVALYATFANRAFDQHLMDVGLHRQPVTLVMDRAGITGPDGPSHHGMWDLAMLGIVPGMRVAAPRDADTLSEELGEAVSTNSGPTALRFPKAPLGDPVTAVERLGGVDLLRAPDRPDVLLVSVGVLAASALEAAAELEAEGVHCTVVDPRWVLPVPTALSHLAASHRLVVTVEDGVRYGGVGSRLAAQLAESDVDVPVRCFGLPSEYIPHGGRAELLAKYGLDAAGITESVRAASSSLARSRRRLQLVPEHRQTQAL